MLRYEDVTVRKFKADDILLKIKWVNDPNNNRYLHYDLPLEYEKTCRWFETVKTRTDRYDGVIEYNGKPVGLVGLLGIDQKNRKAEEYVLIGETTARGKGISIKAGYLSAVLGFQNYGLEKIYAYIEVGNEPSLRRFLRLGYHVEGYLRHDLYFNGRFVDRYLVGMCHREFDCPEGVCVEED